MTTGRINQITITQQSEDSLVHFPTTGESGYAHMVTIHSQAEGTSSCVKANTPSPSDLPFSACCPTTWFTRADFTGHVRLVNALDAANTFSRTLSLRSAKPEHTHSLALAHMPLSTSPVHDYKHPRCEDPPWVTAHSKRPNSLVFHPTLVRACLVQLNSQQRRDGETQHCMTHGLREH